MVADTAKNFPNVTFAVTPAFGLDEKLAEIVLARAMTAPLPPEQLPLHAN
jgi:hypothetical protein